VEASALPAPASLTRTRLSLGTPLLRLRSDEQLVSLFRDGNNEAFRVIHDRYRQRLFAYTRQMLPGSRQDAEDALQDVFVRAYGGLQANHRELALRAWLYRIAHNRCIDELRRPAPPSPEVMELVRPPDTDPIATAEQRESLRRLIADVRRLPDQQRSALLMRELGGMTYTEIAKAMEVSVAAVKSLLVRARVGLAQAAEARDASCERIRADLIVSHDRGVRPTGIARRHMHDCPGCREFRVRLRGTSRQFAAMLPALGPAGVIAKLLGFGGGGGAAVGGGAVAATGAGGTVATAGVLATGAGHAVTLLAAAAVTAGGAVEIRNTIAPAGHTAHHRPAVIVRASARAPAAAVDAKAAKAYRPSHAVAPAAPATVAQAPEPQTPTQSVKHERVDPTFTAPITPGASVSPSPSDPSAGSSHPASDSPSGAGDPGTSGATTGTTTGDTPGTTGSQTPPGDGSTPGATGTPTGSTTSTGSGSPTSTTGSPDGGSTAPPTTSGGSGGSTSTSSGASGAGPITG
jgi:RNA polymerase sigma factor (sigma-70 family)